MDEIYIIIYRLLCRGIPVTLIGIVVIRYNHMHIGTFPFSDVCEINLVIGTVRGSRGGRWRGKTRIRASKTVSRLAQNLYTLFYLSTEYSIMSFSLTWLSNNYNKNIISLPPWPMNLNNYSEPSHYFIIDLYDSVNYCFKLLLKFF